MTTQSYGKIQDFVEGAYFHDHFVTEVQAEQQSALDVYLTLVERMPRWVNQLMALRNWIVSKLGLKHLGRMADYDAAKPSEAYQPGDSLGIFKVVLNRPEEVILEDRDKHLDVKVSFYLQNEAGVQRLHATTVVHVHNGFGKLYMFFVGPVHKLIVPSSLKQLRKPARG
ncbi:DUF2867 domain-containing protein [Balneatrix alpica]|uniref:DUF2867 domain-containing protein n=1 Tax=Balneatrix alpica TaxID=75684 RepID=A0ABV5ZCB5_9GAMM|nr:DUF2867 domain-containing protein [Balneatrix alpica]